MPKLLLFAPCERAIIGQDDQSISLISILAGFGASLPFQVDQPLPEGVALPLRWYLVSIWRGEIEDVGKTLYQKVSLVSPSGKELVVVENSVQIEDQFRLMVKSIVQFQAFPIPEFGTYSVRLNHRMVESLEWTLAADYPLDISRGPVLEFPKPNAQSSVGESVVRPRGDQEGL